MSNATCPETNAAKIDQSRFWEDGELNWDAHRIGWAISGGCAALTVLITIFTVLGHARNYHVPDQQRQIIRILYMPPVFAIISFFSYRFFRAYTYYELAEVVYEAFTISAFTLLIISYVAETASDNTAEAALQRKDKKPLPMPFCCWRYRPTKAYFMYTVKWSVMQYVIVRPLASIAGIICEAFDILCEQSWAPHFAHIWLSAIDFVCISIALYGLWVFYTLTKAELDGRRPFAKFLCIKLIVFFTFYQQFVFSILQYYGVIKETEFWTVTNISDGLNALVTTIEMVFFALLMAWAYPNSEYRTKGERTSPGQAIWDSINFSDFVAEIWASLKFFLGYARNDPGTRTPKVDKPHGADFGDAFGLHKPSSPPPPPSGQGQSIPMQQQNRYSPQQQMRYPSQQQEQEQQQQQQQRDPGFQQGSLGKQSSRFPPQQDGRYLQLQDPPSQQQPDSRQQRQQDPRYQQQQDPRYQQQQQDPRYQQQQGSGYQQDPRYQQQDPRYQQQDPRYQQQDPRAQQQDPRYQQQDPRYQQQGRYAPQPQPQPQQQRYPPRQDDVEMGYSRAPSAYPPQTKPWSRVDNPETPVARPSRESVVYGEAM